MLDTTTLYLSMWGMTLIASVGLVLGLDRSGRKALKMWLVGLILNSTAWLLTIAASHMYERALVTLSVVLMAASMTAVHSSARRFLDGVRPNVAWWLFPPALGFLLFLCYSNPTLRSILTDGAIAVQVAFVCLRIAFGGGRPGRWRVTALIALLIPIPFMIGRVVLETTRATWFDPGAFNLLVNRAGFLADSACIVLLSMAFLLAYGQEAQAKLANLANIDGLSGLLNRRAWSEAAAKVLGSSGNATHTSVVLLLDLDHFKSINDTYGHSVGDKVITCLGETARDVLRTGDVVGRYGGEEFCIFFPDVTEEQLRAVDQRLRRNFADKAARETGIAATFSAGAATVCEGEDLQAALHRADSALYQSKHAGRNRLTIAA